MGGGGGGGPGEREDGEEGRVGGGGAIRPSVTEGRWRGGVHSHALFTGPLGCDGNVTAPLLLSLTSLLIEERQLGLNETGTSWNRCWHSL